MAKKALGLGRGLGALIPTQGTSNTPKPKAPELNIIEDAPLNPSQIRSAVATEDGEGRTLLVPVEDIMANEYQPRQQFSDEDLQELADSIKEYGVIQPLVVDEHPDDGYNLIAGERRLRASKIAGLDAVPVVVRDTNDNERLALAIIENVQRVDLNPIETAQAYQQLIDEFDLTQDEVAKKMGKSRPKITNTLRLLKLHPEVQDAIKEGHISEGHGKVILSAPTQSQQREILNKIMNQDLTVSETEDTIQPRGPRKQTRRSKKDPNIYAKEELLREHFGTKAEILQKPSGTGRVIIEFYSDEELNNILHNIID